MFLSEEFRGLDEDAMEPGKFCCNCFQTLFAESSIMGLPVVNVDAKRNVSQSRGKEEGENSWRYREVHMPYMRHTGKEMPIATISRSEHIPGIGGK